MAHQAGLKGRWSYAGCTHRYRAMQEEAKAALNSIHALGVAANQTKIADAFVIRMGVGLGTKHPDQQEVEAAGFLKVPCLQGLHGVGSAALVSSMNSGRPSITATRSSRSLSR